MHDIEIVEVEVIPNVTRRKRGRSTVEEINARLEKIVLSNVKRGKITLNDAYLNVRSAHGSLSSSAERYGYKLRFFIRRDELYFERTDLM